MENSQNRVENARNESPNQKVSNRPYFYFGQHDSAREIPLTDFEYGHVLNQGVSFVTAPVTNRYFRDRIFALVSGHAKRLEDSGRLPTASGTPRIPDPIVPPLTPEDTGLFPSQATNTYTACTSTWIEPGSANPLVSAISRQVLNLEVAYAGFCGVRNIVVPGPYGVRGSGDKPDLARYARAIREALTIGGRMSLMLSIPMCLDPTQASPEVQTLSSLLEENAPMAAGQDEASSDLFLCWDAWHQIRSVCGYSTRLFLALQTPALIPDTSLVDRWFSEPVNLLILGKHYFGTNKAGYPSLTKQRQDLICRFMRLKHAPWMLLADLGLDPSAVEAGSGSSDTPPRLTDQEFPPLGPQSRQSDKDGRKKQDLWAHVSYLRWLEQQQAPVSAVEASTLLDFQDWLQSPLQPLSDNLESATYEVFEGDPVKYDRYEAAIGEALAEWKQLEIPTSSASGAVVLAVAGAGRGPLVTRALRAGEAADVPLEVWAVEKNPDAYVYLLRQNEQLWDGKVTVVKTDMRAWKGPLLAAGTPGKDAAFGKVDILVSELLGSFGDNELSPECLDGIQHVLARPHGVSIPKSYTAHLSPVSSPRIYADLVGRVPDFSKAFDTPWVVRLFQIDLPAQRVPDHPRFQQAWEFTHPVPDSTLDLVEARRSGGVVGGGGGSMAGAAGANDHNSRYCRLTFVCPNRGVMHGLAGYFESVLFESSVGKRNKVELSTLPDQIDHKSRDMVSWFPIFFPLKKPLYFPDMTELTISMWRQTNDTKVWYEWLVEVYIWVGPKTRMKIGSSELCSSYNVACLL